MTSFDKGMAILELNMAKLEKEMRFLSRAGNSKRTIQSPILIHFKVFVVNNKVILPFTS